MLMVVFGAGASYDSYPAIPPLAAGQPLPDGYRPQWGEYQPYRPPVTSEVFRRRSFVDEVLKEYPELQALHGVLLNPPSGSLEQELESLRDRSAQSPGVRGELLAIQFYLQVLFWHVVYRWMEQIGGAAVTNYAGILRRIRDVRQGEDVLLVTFNYDTMLESALAVQGVAIQGFPDYTATSHKVIKLHGSVNWAHPVRSVVDTHNGTKETVRNLIKMAGQLDIDSNNFVFLPQTNFFSYPAGMLTDDRRQVNVPAIAIPIITKKNYETPPDHFNVLEAALPAVTKALLIGWRAAEHHFLKMLRTGLRKDARVMVVSSGRAGAEHALTNLQQAEIGRDRVRLSDRGFTGFIQSNEPDEFLGS